MAEIAFELDELKVAWRRVKWDLDHRVFVTVAFEEELVDLGGDEWLSQLLDEITQGRYSPQPCEIIEEPKPGFHIRPGARLEIKDQIVYAATAQKLYQVIADFLRVRKTPKDFGYLLRSADKVPWFQQPAFSSWKAFKNVSLERIDAGAPSVVFADIYGFYENIDLNRLRDILRGVGAPEDALSFLLKCLWAWAQPRRRGIPQGLSSSDLLAKLYLEPVDRQLERSGFEHIRYVDDYRIFCSDELEAKRALRKLTALLRHYGLNVGTPKTEIFDATRARVKVEGNIPKIERLAEELNEALRAEGFEDPYLRVIAFPALQDSQANVARAVVEDAFREYFSDSTEPFDASLYHYLLNRLGKLKSDVAIGYSVRQLTDRPEETRAILEYLKHFLDDHHDLADEVLRFAESDDAIYEHQLFLIVKWLHENRVQSDRCFHLVRRLTADRSQPLWLRSYALALLGEFGDSADLDGTEALYTNAATELERAVILCCIRRMPRNQRNEIYARYGEQSLLNALATRLARQN